MGLVRILIFTINILLSIQCLSQNESVNWYFGDSTGLSFTTGIPKVINTNNSQTFGSNVSYSDPFGKLLFYGGNNGKKNTYYNKLGGVMPNSNLANLNSSDSMVFKLLIPKPNTPSQYYIFTKSQGSLTPSINYTLIDLSLNSGKGDIIKGKENVEFIKQKLTKSLGIQMTMTIHKNKRDYWLIIPKVQTDTIFTYKITPRGIDSSYIINKTNIILEPSSGSGWNVVRISPNNSKIVFGSGSGCIIADFNDSSGILKNFIQLQFREHFGAEFSPNNKYLYIAERTRVLAQYNISQYSKNSIINSRLVIDSLYSRNIWNLQLALDGKIYIGSENDSFVHVIHAPDSVGYKCRPQKKYINLTRTYSGFFPIYPSYLFEKKEFIISRNCIDDSTYFYISDLNRIDSLKWDFGDSLSGLNNFSNSKIKPFHIYNSTGYFKVKLTWYFNNQAKTTIQTIYIKDPTPNLGNDTSYCGSFGLLLKPKRNYLSYQWNTGDKNSAIFVFSKGTYWLRALDSLGCWSNDTIIIKNPSITPSFSINDSSQCLKGNVFNCFDNTKFQDDKRFQTTWRFSDGVTINDSVASKSFSNSGNYTITLEAHSKLGCVDSITRKIQVFEQSQIGFKINQPQQCFNKQSFDFTNTSYSNDSLTFHWDLGDLNTSQKHYFNKQYTQTGNYSVRLVTLSDKGCSDTLIKSINILPAPKADFNWGVVCDKSLSTFNFTGTVPSSPTITSYSWHFPSDSSNLINPKVLLSQTGLNKVRLYLKTDNGCSDQITKDIDVKPQATADFEASDVCEDSLATFINKTQISNRIVNYKWFFGDGNSSSIEHPKHSYVINGFTKTFNVKLTSIVQNGCSDSILKALTINAKPKQGFTYSVNNLTVNFLANEANGIKYHWTFGDGTTTIINKKDYQYTYSKFPSGKYKACLEVTNLADCKSDTCLDIQFSGTIHSLNRNSIILYPNPNSGHFTLELTKPNSTIEIFNSIGQKLHYSNITEIKTELNLELENGVYLFRISNGEEVLNQKIIVKK